MAQTQLLAAANRVASYTSPDIYKSGQYGVHGVLNISVAPGIETLTLKLQGKTAAGDYYDIAASAAIVATGINRLAVGAGLIAIANVMIPDMVPDIYRWQVIHSAGSIWNYTLCENNMS